MPNNGTILDWNSSFDPDFTLKVGMSNKNWDHIWGIFKERLQSWNLRYAIDYLVVMQTNSNLTLLSMKQTNIFPCERFGTFPGTSSRPRIRHGFTASEKVRCDGDTRVGQFYPTNTFWKESHREW